MQADKDFPEDTLAAAHRELEKSEQNLQQTLEVVEQARHIASTLRAERTTNHWAKSIYENWYPGSGRHTA